MLIFELKGAAKERLEIKTKNQEGKVALFKRHPYIVIDGRIPFGYKKVYNTEMGRYLMEEDAEEVALVKKVFNLILEGKTLYYVVKYLSDRNMRFRNLIPTTSYISRLLHNDLYRGIRTRKYKGEVYTTKIKPIITEEDFLRVAKMAENNHKFVSNSKNRFNPLKGILRCRCGKAMTIKDKHPEKGVTKLVYRCSNNYPKGHAHRCNVNVDEVSYELTNSIIKSLFMQRYVDIKDYFNKNSDIKIKEAEEVIEGLETKLVRKQGDKKRVEDRIEENANKIILLSDIEPIFINKLNKNHKFLTNEKKRIEEEITNIRTSIAENRTKIAQLKSSIIKDDKVYFDISDEELSEIYHTYLDKIEYYSHNIMKGTYKVYYKSGDIDYIIVYKVRSIPSAYVLTNNASINLGTGEITIKCTIDTHRTINDFTFPETKTEVVNIQDIFKSWYVETNAFVKLRIDTSYRNKKAQPAN